MPIEPLQNVQYRLSRVHNAGFDLQSYNRIICYGERFSTATAYFVEGFNANDFILEAARGTWSFRKNTLVPAMEFNFDRFTVIGDEDNQPIIRARLSLTPAPFDLTINEEAGIYNKVFSCQFILTDASNGQTIDAYNCTDGGDNTNINFYDREVRRIGKQRNELETRQRIKPTPPPEPFTEKILETI